MFNIYATDYAPVDPITPPCDIVPIFIGYKGENKARCLVFDLTECVSTFGDGGFVISFIRQGDELPYLVTNTDRLDNNAIWIINSTDTAVDGYGMVQLQYIVDDVICKSALYRTVTFDSNGITGDVPDPYEDLLAQIAAYAATAEGAATTATAAANTATTAVENGIVTERSQRIAADNSLQQQITNLMGLAGAPVMANTAAAMTDSTKIYIYTGSEAGYTFGNWYYFNGAEWVSGGVYQASAVQTDPTLSVEGMAADAAATGDLKSQIMSAFVEETTSGSIASFTDGADDVPVKDLVVNITPKQAGTGDPSPTNIRAITGWTAANITRCGKNYLQFSLGDGTYYGMQYTTVRNAAGAITGLLINGTCTGSPGSLPIAKVYQPNFKIVMECTTPANISFRWRVRWKTNGVVQGNSTDSWFYTRNGKQVLSPSLPSGYDEYEILLVFSNSVVCDNLAVSIMAVNTDETDDTFEPYNGNTYNVSFGSAGTVYGGTLDVTSGMLTVTHAYKQFSNLLWAYNTSYGSFYCYLNDKSTESMCDRYPRVAVWSTFLNTDDTYWSAGTSLYVRDADYTTVDAFLAAMGNAQFVYSLAQPVSVQLTATEVRTLLGNNNIWSDTGSVASCEYRADTQLYIEKLTNPDSDMTADSNIASGQYFMVGNTLYLATAAIASGATIVPGTNCTETSLAAALNAINA